MENILPNIRLLQDLRKQSLPQRQEQEKHCFHGKQLTEQAATAYI